MKSARFLAALSAACVIALSAAPVLADSPHFTNVSRSIDGTGDLVVSVKAAGLGTNAKLDLEVTADAHATWGCITNSGHLPSASNKTTTNTNLDQTGSINANGAGNATGSITVSATLTEPTLQCGTGQTEELISISYTNIVLTGFDEKLQENLTNSPFSVADISATLITLKK
jgi:hypothetical protein